MFLWIVVFATTILSNGSRAQATGSLIDRVEELEELNKQLTARLRTLESGIGFNSGLIKIDVDSKVRKTTSPLLVTVLCEAISGGSRGSEHGLIINAKVNSLTVAKSHSNQTFAQYDSLFFVVPAGSNYAITTEVTGKGRDKNDFKCSATGFELSAKYSTVEP